MAELSFRHIDQGQPFDFGKTAADYARYRDIYPASLYAALLQFGIVRPGLEILDVGTGSGVIPRHLQHTGAHFCATDVAAAQIDAARQLSVGMPIDYAVAPAEKSPFAAGSFDRVIACQCFWYFDIPTFLAELRRILRPDGKFCRIVMEWLPFESRIAATTEQLVRQFNPNWNGLGYQLREYVYPKWAGADFELETFHSYREDLPFTADTWSGRMRSCRGIGATLPPEKVAEFDTALRRYLGEETPAAFTIPHAIQIEVFRWKAAARPDGTAG